jgi:hypothetical protein
VLNKRRRKRMRRKRRGIRDRMMNGAKCLHI